MKFKYIKGTEKDFEGAPEWALFKVLGNLGGIFFTEKQEKGARCCNLLSKSKTELICGLIDNIETIIAQREPIAKSQSWYEKGELPPVGDEVIWVDESDTEAPDDVVYPEIGNKVKIITHSKSYDGKYPVAVFKWLHEDGEIQRYAASGHYLDFKPLKTKEQKEKEELSIDLVLIARNTIRRLNESDAAQKLYDMGWRKVEREKK